MKRILAIGITLLFIGISTTTSANTLVEKSYIFLQYTPHDPIYINGNDEFTFENGVTGGSGTPNDPFIIEDWDINASSQDGITIRNVNIFFKIKNCYIHNGDISNNDGIVFINVINGVIEDTTITDNLNGIIFRTQHSGKENSENNTICHNLITMNEYTGINFEHTVHRHHCNNIILNNSILGNNMGVYMIMSADNQLFYNNIISNGLGIGLDMCMGGGMNNKIHQNNFINNDEHAFNNMGKNKWFEFNYFKSKGNYWDDWRGLNIKWAKFFPFLYPYKINGQKFLFDWFPAYEPYDIEV